MTGRKGMLAKCLATGRVLPALGRLRAACRPDIPILAYHRIWDLPDEDLFPFDVELVSATIDDFAWQMSYVKENFTPITFHTLIKILDGELPPVERPLVITFDDGYDDNFHHAFPILMAYEVPATIFLATGYIDSGETFWYDRLAQLLLCAPDQEISVTGLDEPLALGVSSKSRRQTIYRLLTHLKRVPDEWRLETLRRLEAVLDPEGRMAHAPESRPMNWNQVREMSAAGMEFGSHTVNHPVLANLRQEDLWTELWESKHELERQIGKPVEVICYPVGGQEHFDERVQHLARGAGYRLGVSYIPGTNYGHTLDCFALRRLRVERYLDRAYFAAMLNLPELFK